MKRLKARERDLGQLKERTKEQHAQLQRLQVRYYDYVTFVPSILTYKPLFSPTKQAEKRQVDAVVKAMRQKLDIDEGSDLVQQVERLQGAYEHIQAVRLELSLPEEDHSDLVGHVKQLRDENERLMEQLRKKDELLKQSQDEADESVETRHPTRLVSARGRGHRQSGAGVSPEQAHTMRRLDDEFQSSEQTPEISHQRKPPELSEKVSHFSVCSTCLQL